MVFKLFFSYHFLQYKPAYMTFCIFWDINFTIIITVYSIA